MIAEFQPPYLGSLKPNRFWIYLILLTIILLVAAYFIFAEETAETPYFSENSLFLKATTGALTGIEAELWKAVEKYELDYERFYGLAMCESTLNPDAKGKAGEIGIFQFMPTTFSDYAERYNLKADFSIHETNHQIELAARMIADDKASEWVCLY